MSTLEPYSVELMVRHLPTAPEGVVELVLDDRQVSGRVTVATARLRFDEPALRETAADFLRGDAPRHAKGLAYGRALAARLFAPEGLGPVWTTLQHDRGARPLRLVLTLPATEEGRAALDEIPFELLADEGDGGFWFRRPGWSLVRAFEGVPGVRYTLPSGSRALLAWANPAVPDDRGGASTLPAEVFAAHEAAFAREAAALPCTVRPPLRRATREGLAAALRERPETPLLSLVAHGDPRGGALVFHAEEASDEGAALLAHDLAKRCRDGGVKVTLLWSCHGARRHAHRSSVAAMLLYPEHGDGAAVVASHAALVAEQTARMVGPLLRSLRDVAEGDLERALAEARHALDSDNLQWAAPVYYARPLEGRSVTVEAAVTELVARSASRGPSLVEGAPEPKPWFRGREDDLTRVLAYVKAHRLTTLTGGPGIGKTTLAAEVARRAIGDASWGLSRAVWLDVSTQRSVDTLREALALLFGLDPARCASDLALATALRDQRALAVLDNAEDLLRTHGEALRALVGELLRRAPGMRLLATSRRVLGDATGRVDGETEQPFAVDRLPPGVDRAVFVAVAGEKLGADGSTPAVDELVRALAGHPQSIVLVAGQVGRGLTPAELLTRVKAEDADVIRDAALLDDELEETSDARLRTRRLVSSLNLSFVPLVASAPGAAEMFAWLGNFPGGLPEVLLARVFGADARRHLGRLMAYNMVERRGVDERITLAGPVRWYARARQRAMVAGREVIAAARRAELMEHSAEAMAGWLEALASLTGRPGAASACARARDDGETLGVLAEGLRELLDGERAGARVGAAFYALSHLARYGAYHREVEAAGDRVRGVLREVGARRGLAEVGRALGDLYVRADRLVEAERAYGEALPIYRAIEDRLGEANTLQALGDLYVRTDRLVEAERAYGEALPIYRAIDARLGEANTLKALGDLYVRTARLVEAERAYGEALPIYRAIDARLGEANTLRALGDLYARTARLVEAERAYGEALPIYRAIDARLGEANTLKALGDLYVRTDRLVEAERAYGEVLPIYRAIEDRLGEANTLQALGDLYVRTDRLVEAERAYGEALPIYRAIDARLGEANTLQALGDLYVRTSRLVEAERAYGEVLPIYRAIDARLGEANTLRALGDLFVRTDRLVEAERAYGEALPIYRAIDARLGEANTLQALGGLFVRTDRLVEAERAYGEALPIYRAIDARLGEANTLQALGDLFVRTDRLVEAERAYGEALPIYRAIDARLGEANTLQALGDLYVRTDRLVEAERAYGEALPIYRAIDARLGEANTLQALGGLHLVRNQPHAAFAQYLDVLRIQRSITDRLGEGGTHGYLARAAGAAHRFERAVVLACRAFSLLRSTDSRFGQMLAASDLLPALAHLEDAAIGAVLALVWALARSIDDPRAERFAPFLREMNLDPDTLSPDALLPEALAAFDELSERYERMLRERGEDPYSPLDAPP